jgi:tetratricopeptide (TPR) repeat protein
MATIRPLTPVRHVLACRALALSILAAGCASSTEQQINYGLNHYEMGLWGPATIRPLVSAANSLEKTSPPDPRLPRVLLALGTMAESHKRDDLAEDFFRRALKAAEALRPADEAQTRNALVDLCLCYTRQGREKEAVPLLERAAAISAGLPQRYLYAIDLDNLAIALDQQKRHSEANALSMKALAVLDSVPPGGMEDRTRGVILHNVARSYVDQGRYGEAEKLYRDSLTILEAGSSRDVESWRLRIVLKNYAGLLRQTGREAEAQALERRAAAIK